MALKTVTHITDKNSATFAQRVAAEAQKYQDAGVAVEVQYQATSAQYGDYGVQFEYSALLVARGRIA